MKTVILLLILILPACTLEDSTSTGGDPDADSTLARVIRVSDGDTIRVEIDGEEYSVRYVGINTPEEANFGDPAEPCAEEATAANAGFVAGQVVRLERDETNTDRFDRLLRYVYVGDVFVNEALVRQGYAEVVIYEPDDREFENFRALEQAAAAAGLGCHPTGIFDDGTYRR